MTRWSHVALNCRDLDRTERFYTRWFSFTRVHDFDLDPGRIVFLRAGDAYLELFGSATPEPAGPPAGPGDGPGDPGSVRHIAFQVDDVDALVAEMGEEARITLGPLDFDAFIPGWRTVWVSDPDGVVVEVSQGFRDDATAAAPGSTDAGE